MNNSEENNYCSSNDKNDIVLSNSIMFFFIIQSANSSIKTIFPDLAESYGGLMSAISGVLIIFFLYKGLLIVWRWNAHAVVVSYLLFTLIYSVSFILNISRNAPIDALFSESFVWTMLWWIPMGLIIYSVNNKAILYERMVKWSYLLSLVTMTAMISYVSNIVNMNISNLTRGNYNMFFSYMLVFPLVIHLNEITNRKFEWNIPFFIVEFLSIVVNGSRGAFLCIGGFLLLKVLLGKLSVVSKIRIALLSIVAASTIYFGSQFIFSELESYGITSRTMEKFASGEGAESDDRWEMYGYAIDFIKEKPFLGYGLGGDFHVMYQKVHGTMPLDAKDASLTVHNGFLQILMCFGVFLGTIAIFIFWRPLLLFPKINDADTRMIMVILFAVFIIPSFTTGDGIFVKPGIALYIYLFYNWFNHREQEIIA